MEKFNVRRVRPDFPEYKTGGVTGFFQFLLALLIWAGLLFLFAFTVYTNWFCRNLYGLLVRINLKPSLVPFWFGAVLVILIFPLTLAVILINQFVKILID